MLFHHIHSALCSYWLILNVVLILACYRSSVFLFVSTIGTIAVNNSILLSHLQCLKYIIPINFFHAPGPGLKKNHDFLFKSDFFFFFFFKSGIHNVIKYLTIRLSGVNTATQVCALRAFGLKNTKLC